MDAQKHDNAKKNESINMSCIEARYPNKNEVENSTDYADEQCEEPIRFCADRRFYGKKITAKLPHLWTSLQSGYSPPGSNCSHILLLV